MSHTVEDVRHRLKRLREAAGPNLDPHIHFKMGDMDCEFLLQIIDDMIEGFEGHFGKSFGESPLGKRINSCRHQRTKS
jgi:hypothetical protein